MSFKGVPDDYSQRDSGGLQWIKNGFSGMLPEENSLITATASLPT